MTSDPRERSDDDLLCFRRILNKFLDNYQEDVLPWHESIEPCLSSTTAFINDREVSDRSPGQEAETPC